MSNGTWVFVPCQTIMVNFILLFKKKHNEDGSLARQKDRLVAIDKSQRPDIGCDHNFSFVVKSATICKVPKIFVSQNRPIQQLMTRLLFFMDIFRRLYT